MKADILSGRRFHKHHPGSKLNRISRLIGMKAGFKIFLNQKTALPPPRGCEMFSPQHE